MPILSDLSIAVLIDHGVDYDELVIPREEFENAAIRTEMVSPSMPEIKTWNDNTWGVRIKIDKSVQVASPDQYDGLFIPGGVLHIDQLRTNPEAVSLVKQFFAAGKLIAAIGHGIQLLSDAGIIEGRLVTSFPSLKKDIVNAGGIWTGEDIVADNGIITCQCADAAMPFAAQFMDKLRDGAYQRTETII